MTTTTTDVPVGEDAPRDPGGTGRVRTPRTTRRRGGGLGSYILVRALLIIPTVFILVTTVFVVMRANDPITAALGGRLTPDQLAERIHEAGYDRPVVVQYLEYLGGIVRGDFGTTISDNRPVTEVLATYGTATLELAVYALLVAFVVGIPLGMLAGYLRDRVPDAILRVSAILAYATPVFFAGLMLKLVFSVWLGWLPVSGRASTDAEIELQFLYHPTGFYLIDAIRGRGTRRSSATSSSTPSSRRSRSGCSRRACSCGSCAPTSSGRSRPTTWSRRGRAACASPGSCARTRGAPRSSPSSPSSCSRSRCSSRAPCSPRRRSSGRGSASSSPSISRRATSSPCRGSSCSWP